MKKIKHNLTLAIGSLAAISPIAAVSSCTLFNNSDTGRSKLLFSNYELYMNDENKDVINQYYHYGEFGDLPDFERDIDAQVTIGGIGSDYFSAKLANKGKIRKLEFDKLFGISSDRTKWAEELKNIYTPTAWNILNSYQLTKMDKNANVLYRINKEGTEWTIKWDSSITYYDKDGNTTLDKKLAISHDVDGDGIEDNLWEFAAPYFNQTKTIAFNPYSFSGNNPAIERLKEAKNQGEVNALFEASDIFKANPKYSYGNILSWLKSIGGDTLLINDYMRDNMSIGSELLDGSRKLDTKIDSVDEGKSYLNDFKNTILKSWKNKGGIIKPASTDGTKVLMDLNRVKGQESGKTDVAILYNGDALDAYFAGEWDDDLLNNNSKKQIRVLTPENSAWFLDTVVLAKETSTSPIERDRFYNALRNGMFGFANTNNTLNGYAANDDNMLFKNFDLIQYTPAYKYLYNYLTGDVNTYFDGDQMALDILKTPVSSNNLLLNSVISDDLRSSLSDYNGKIIRSLT